MAGTPTEDERRLYAYIHGWRVGAKGGLIPGLAGEDFRQGHADGREAAAEAYRAACERYGAELSPFR